MKNTSHAQASNSFNFETTASQNCTNLKDYFNFLTIIKSLFLEIMIFSINKFKTSEAQVQKKSQNECTYCM